MYDSDLIIKKMQQQDIPFVAEIEKECFSSPWSEQGLESELSNPLAEFFVLFKNGTPAAYMGTHLVLDECYVANLAVKDCFRRQGLGLRLVENAISLAKAKGCRFISLEVRVSNRGAISLYKRCGFESLGERKNFYSSPTENALIMTKYLTETEGT